MSPDLPGYRQSKLRSQILGCTDDSCPQDNVPAVGYIGDSYVFKYIPLYLTAATSRLNAYTGGNKFTSNDTYAMQSICAYEYNTLGSSDFCGLFTEAEWEGFEYTLDLEYYYDYSEFSLVGGRGGKLLADDLIRLVRLRKPDGTCAGHWLCSGIARSLG